MARQLEKIKEELDKLTRRRDSLNERIKALQDEYTEAENTMVTNAFHEAGLTLEQFSELLQKMGNRLPNREDLEEVQDK
ncbi:MAG: DUF4315 family protein [Eubacterium sp.]|nr:DUF4315 family protein [Eubacterium sp.]